MTYKTALREDLSGRSALLVACNRLEQFCVHLLLKEGLNAELRDASGQSALHLAVLGCADRARKVHVLRPLAEAADKIALALFNAKNAPVKGGAFGKGAGLAGNPMGGSQSPGGAARRMGSARGGSPGGRRLSTSPSGDRGRRSRSSPGGGERRSASKYAEPQALAAQAPPQTAAAKLLKAAEDHFKAGCGRCEKIVGLLVDASERDVGTVLKKGEAFLSVDERNASNATVVRTLSRPAAIYFTLAAIYFTLAAI